MNKQGDKMFESGNRAYSWAAANRFVFAKLAQLFYFYTHPRKNIQFGKEREKRDPFNAAIQQH